MMHYLEDRFGKCGRKEPKREEIYYEEFGVALRLCSECYKWFMAFDETTRKQVASQLLFEPQYFEEMTNGELATMFFEEIRETRILLNIVQLELGSYKRLVEKSLTMTTKRGG